MTHSSRPHMPVLVPYLLGAVLLPTIQPCCAHAQEKDAPLEAMRARIADVQADFAEQQDRSADLKQNQTPLLRFSDPAREGFDGTLWLWSSDSRPVALLSLTRYPEFWNYEHISLTERPLAFTGAEGWRWSSEGKAREWRRLVDPVAGTSQQRIIQMRGISRQFRAVEHYEGQQYHLRLLSRPVHLYSNPETALLNGGLFIFSHETNPEIVMSIESRETDDGMAAWFVAFARTAASDLTVYHGDAEVWKRSHIDEWNPREEYYGHTVPMPGAEIGE